MNDGCVKILSDSIAKWKPDCGKIIIGIDGYSGAGKTTLLSKLNQDDFLIVNRDDFAIPRKIFETKFKNAKTEKEKIDVTVNETIDIKELALFLDEYKRKNGVVEWPFRGDISGKKDISKKFDFSKKILIIEGIFLFHNNNLNRLFDKKIFIDVDQEIADERRRKREKEKWGDDYFPDTHPDSYFRLIKIGFNDYLKEYDPKSQADLIIK